VTGFAEGDVVFVLARDGLEVRWRAEMYASEHVGIWVVDREDDIDPQLPR